MQPMTPEEVDTFLDSKPGWIVLTTIGKDGYPHAIPIGYFRVGEHIYCGARQGTQKFRNIERNPRVSLTLEAGTTRADIRGVLVQGDAEAVIDDEERLSLAREAARLRGQPESEWPSEPSSTGAYIKVTPRKVISWDASKG